MGKKRMSLFQEMEMDKSVFSVVRLEDDPDEAAYWQTQTPRARWRHWN